MVTLDSVLTWGNSVSLEENEDVQNVGIDVTLAPGDSFIVLDRKEEQLRHYGPDGQLFGHVGGIQPGAAQRFETPVSATAVLEDDRILAAEFIGKLHEFTPDFAEHPSAVQTPVAPLYAVCTTRDDGLVILVGRLANSGDQRLVHVWDRHAQRVVRSFFEPQPYPKAITPAALVVDHGGCRIYGDTVFAWAALAPVLHLFTIAGAPIGEVQLRLPGFREVSSGPPSRSVGDRGVIERWAQDFSRLQDVWRLSDGGFLTQYYDLHGRSLAFSLARISSQGKILFDISETPQLLAVTPEERLLFVDPTASTPSRWRWAVLRPGRA